MSMKKYLVFHITEECSAGSSPSIEMFFSDSSIETLILDFKVKRPYPLIASINWERWLSTMENSDIICAIENGLWLYKLEIIETAKITNH